MHLGVNSQFMATTANEINFAGCFVTQTQRLTVCAG